MIDDIVIKQLTVGAFSSNCYIVGSVTTKQGLVIDPGGNVKQITEAIDHEHLEIGTIFLTLDRKVRYFHALWHMFVVAGSICHYVGVLVYVALR